jgi:ABC-2 type transport system ATP-binding protein
MTLIYKGNQIAIGTPAEMKTTQMKDAVLEIIVPNAEDWVERLGKAQCVKEAALFSTKIHAVSESADISIPAIKEMLDKGGVTGYDVRKIMPSLEDVFVSSIEAYDKEHGGR